MNNQDPHATPVTTPVRRSWPARALALGAAACIGGLATLAVSGPSAFAATAGDALQPAAWMQHLHGHADVHDHVDGVLAKAGVSPAQRQQIHAIAQDAMKAEHADMARYHASLAETKRLLAAPRIDLTAIESARAEQDRLLLDTNRRVTETLLRAANVLTPAQRQALSAEIDRMMASRMGHDHAG